MIKTTVTIPCKDGTVDINLFDINNIGPFLLANKKNSFGTNIFAIKATDGITTQKARPIRQHELLNGAWIQEQASQATNQKNTEWNSTFDCLAETAPVQTWSPLFAAVCAAELECATEEISRLHWDKSNMQIDNLNRHSTDSKALFVHAERPKKSSSQKRISMETAHKSCISPKEQLIDGQLSLSPPKRHGSMQQSKTRI
jgi:hypothetical protein